MSEPEIDSRALVWTGVFARRLGAEVAGTALLVGVGTGAIVESYRFGAAVLGGLAVAWFLAVFIPICLFVRVSGAHLNPAVTLALATSGRIGWREVGPYWGAQFGGALLGSTLVLVVAGGARRLGATVPVAGAIPLAFALEFASSVALMLSVFTLADRGEGPLRWRLLLPPAVVALSTYFIGPWTGSSLNPARTLAPAVLSGTYTDIWVYLTAVPAAALAVGALWKPRAVDRLDRGPGRRIVSR